MYGMCDMEHAISNAAITVFPGSKEKWLVCWFHVVMNLMDTMKELKFDYHLITKIKEDFETIHNQSDLSVATNLYGKWKSNLLNLHQDSITKEIFQSFIVYTDRYYLPILQRWISPLGEDLAATNNLCERFNRHIKEVIFGKKLQRTLGESVALIAEYFRILESELCCCEHDNVEVLQSPSKFAD